MTVDSQLLRRFLDIDQNTSLDQLQAFIHEISPRRANAFVWSIRKHLPPLSDADIARLVEVFTLLENALGSSFCGGSTTQVPILLAELRRRDAEAAEHLTDWAFTVAKNPYNPFGTFNASRTAASSVAEYFELEAARASRNRETTAARSALAEERAAQRSLNHRNRLAAHDKRNEQLNAYLEGLALLAPAERLRSLLANDWHFGAIPGEYANATVAKTLSDDEQQQLVARLERAPRGAWAALCLALTAERR